MIARWFAPALVLPLVAAAQVETAPRARWPQEQRAEDDAPRVRVWIPGGGSFRFAQPVQVLFEVSEDAHAVVLRVDGNGHLSVLWPQSRNLQTAARAGREYRITGAQSSLSAFNADYEYGSGMVIAIASPDPIDLSAYVRYRNDQTYWRYVSGQRPYYGGVRRVLDRITQEVLYAPDSPYDYDIAFYSVAGRSFFSNASYAECQYEHLSYPTAYYRSYLSWPRGSMVRDWDDCSGGSFYRNHWIYCASWAAVNSGAGSAWCQFWNPNWPVPPIAGTPQPQPPRPNTDMIDTIMSRPVDKYPLIDRKAEPTTPNGTTHTVYMEPVRETTGGTRWIPEDDDAISIPRLRRSANGGRDQPRGGDRISTRDEGFTRSPGTNIRTTDPRAGDQPPDRSPGGAFMPPVRQAPRPEPVWRDNDRPDRGGNGYTPPQRWERPVSSEPRNPSSDGGRVDRGSTSSGTASPSGAGAAVTPKTEPPKTEPPSKAPDAKASGERKPH